MSGNSGTAHVRRRQRAGTLAALTVTAVLALVGVGASPAWAHAILERATPAGGTAAATSPATVTLGFSESVRSDSTSVRVIDARGTRVDTGGAHGGPTASQVTVALKPDLPKGTYLVSWHVISEDSHPVAGGYAFGIGRAPTASEAAAANTAQPGSPVTGFVFGVARLVAFGGMAVLLGAGFFLLVLWPAGLRRLAPRRLLVAGWVAAFVGAAACVFLQGPYGDDLGLSALFRWAPLGSTLADRYGKLTLIRLLALLLAVPLLRALLAATPARPDGQPARTGEPGWRPSAWTRAELGGLAVAVAATTALTGHGGVGSWAWLATASITAHLLAMSVWLGGLAVLATGLLDRRRPAPSDGEDHADWAEAIVRQSSPHEGDAEGELDDEAALAAARAYLDEHDADVVPVEDDRAAELAEVLPRWSRVAMTAVGLIVLSGVYQSWRELGAVGALFDTAYGRLLLYKLWFVLAMLGVGFLSNRWVIRHFRPVALAMTAETDATNAEATGEADDGAEDELDEEGRRRVTQGALGVLRRGVMVEAVIGLAVLAVTAALVNHAPGRTTYAPPFHTTTTAGPLTVDVRVSPTRTGLETVDVRVRDPQGQPQRLVEASVTLSLPAAQVGPIDVPMVAAGTGELIAQDAQVPLAGSWRMGITVRINDFDEYATAVTYTVR
ncbi:copper resistance protein CopC [Frankia sp. AgB1.9]|uniref:copper resistance CopC/CopD family protein n=1 Tax=unclassified Frankia TaxID=2632575 RepID=UPI00193207A6|nr:MULTISPECIES: copper resistance protein CopC [unclassified Frankia]MBL7491766.1 copper resistance protein CopC [Frankia sp. AgW1.1]MBL7551710.1 copper resistance protein CopC [Frankia sp. AgB1.9]